ncbi:TPA: type II toxin-antitoxin system HicA family toxin [Candidatus Nomurabacteria bacterium]|nr:type II toxin-antitoxin system HicA family toxin [Candidatus Nomurabacteria bacterium]
MPRLKSSKEIIKILEVNGFHFVSQKGSHGKFNKEGLKIIVIVPMNKREIPIGTLMSIIRQSKLDRVIFD